jgi:peptidase U49-like protein
MAKTTELMSPYFRRIEQALLAVAPERNDELVSAIFKNKLWHLTATDGSPVAGFDPFKAYPTDKNIQVSYAGLAMLWCLAVYAALTLDVARAAHGLSGQIDVSKIFGKAQRFLDYATVLRTHDKDWPPELYAPVQGKAGEPFETIDRIFFGAVSWMLLHEIAHVHFQHEEGLLPKKMIQQEDDADQFATCWIFDQVPSDEERELRILFVGVAIAWLLLFEPHGGDSNHPPAVVRMMHLASYFGARGDSAALEVLAHLLKVLFSPAVPAPEFKTSQELLDWTIELFRRPA